MASGTVLLTGATGFVGVRILAMALERGYRVRCAVRSPSGMDRIRETPSIKKLAPTNDQLSSVVVPDITVPNAYDQAVSGVQFIIHVASPIHVNSNDPESTSDEDFIRPAVNGTVGMLESAATYGAPLLKRVVLTSDELHHRHDPPRVFPGHRRPPTTVLWPGCSDYKHSGTIQVHIPCLSGQQNCIT